MRKLLKQEASELDIPSEDARKSLFDFAVQTHLNIAGDIELLRGVMTRAISGRYNALDALDHMLAGTGLAYEILGDRMIAIKKIPVSVEHSPPERTSSGERKTAPTRREIEDTGVQVLISALRPSTALAGLHQVVFDRVDMDRASGITVQDFLRTFPSIFGGGPTEDTTKGLEASTNSSRGSGVNIRGLDASATVVLIDGLRIAPSGTQGAFVDVANIPLSALERIEILSDGAPIRYGTDAPGGIINLVTRNRYVGREEEAWGGLATDGTVNEQRYSFVWGIPFSNFGDGHAVLTLERYVRSPLAAEDRAQAKSDLQQWGGQDFDIPFGNPGTIVIGSQTWAIPRGQNGISLPMSALVPGTVNDYSQFAGAAILPGQERNNLLGSMRDELANGVQLFANALIGKRSVESSLSPVTTTLTVPQNNPFYVNPTGATDPIQVNYGFGADVGPQVLRGDVNTRNINTGFSWNTGNWRWMTDAGYSSERERLATSGEINFEALETALTATTADQAFNPFGDGSHTSAQVIASIRAEQSFASDSSYEFMHLSASGPLMMLPAGPVNMEVGAEYRHQILDTVAGETALPPVSSNLSRKIRSVYSQLQIPLVQRQSRPWGLNDLRVTAGLRWDQYSDVGGTTNPVVGVSWTPVGDLLLRATFARSFRPPDLPQRVELANPSAILALPDPSSPKGTAQTLVWAGNNADLKPESARSWSVGADWTTLPFLSDSSLSVTFFDVLFDNRIDDASLTSNPFTDRSLSDRIIRDPSPALRAEVCGRSTFEGDPSQCLSGSIDALLDLRLRNIDVLRTRGLDLLWQYDSHTQFGGIGFKVEGTYLLHYSMATGPSSLSVDLLNTETNPINVRVRGTATWSNRDTEVTVIVNYANSYRDAATVPARPIASWTTLDLNVAYTLRNMTFASLSSAQLFLKIENLFDRYPPFVNNQSTNIGYDQENGDLLGRFVTLGIRTHW